MLVKFSKSRHSAREKCANVLAVLGILLGIAVIVASIAYLAYFFVEYDVKTEVKLSYGTVKGKIIDAPEDKKVRRFLGIPYAKPPVGKRRFANPEEIDKFPEDPYEASDYKYSCLQFLDTTYGDFKGSDMLNAPNPLREDCLFLNIWTPVPPAHRNNNNQKYPVMVWIYGGGFARGSSALDLYEGTALASHGDVVVVSFNYRLGAMGFLATGDGRIKGNYGMMDQVLAMRWIKNNIKHFDGDPDKITLFGESAGASSIGLHLLSPLTNGLFHRAILQSAGPEARWSFMSQQEAMFKSKLFLQAVNCQITDPEELLVCLRNLDADTILYNHWVEFRSMSFPWVPTVDGVYLTDTPGNLINNGQLRVVDAILGVNANEGTYFNVYSLPGFDKDSNSHHNFSMFVEAEIMINWDLTPAENRRVIDFYSEHEIKDTNDLVANRDALDKVTGDRFLTCPTKDFALDLLEAGGAKQYFYYLSHRASNEVWPEWMGVIHGAEIQWIFGAPFLSDDKYTEDEKDLSRAVMSYFANFAKNGNPNENELVHWPQNTLERQKILEIAAPNRYRILHNLRDQLCAFWKTF